MGYRPDVKKNNKLAIRNFKEACDKHDVVKLMIMRMLRRAHPDSRFPIYSEHNGDDPNDNYPDIWMRLHKHRKAPEIYVYEIQEKVTPEWEENINKQHEHVNLIIVPLKKISDNLDEMREQLKEYVI